MRWFLPALSLALSLVLPQGVLAQQSATDSVPRKVQQLAPISLIEKQQRGYRERSARTATKTLTLLRDVPQAVTVIPRALIADQSMQGMADVARYIPGITMGQGEGNRDQPTVRGNGSTAAFFVDGLRDDAQYFRDLYNVERVEALKGANALIFGRGVGGGALNRVTKEASFNPLRQLTLSGGSFGHRRAAVDLGSAAGDHLALRLNAVYENSDLFRRGVALERSGITPTLTLTFGRRTRLLASYERFHDRRTADRGIPSFAGTPLTIDRRVFFGDPRESQSTATVDAAVLTVEHTTQSGLVLRNRSRFTDYEKAYQNVFPGAVDAAGTLVAISAYSNRHDRRNLFNQSEASYRYNAGPLTHTLLAGVEIGRQRTDNVRNTGYFNNNSTSLLAPLEAPTVAVPVTFRPSATDADNQVVATTSSLYLQDQFTIGSWLQLVAGLRYEQFRLAFHNNRTGQDITRPDGMLAPRFGLVLTPVGALSLYASYSLAYLPSSGDQFASLTATTATLEPERFRNREVGIKWDIGDALSLTAAVYQLDRTNTAAPDPADPSRTVQTGSQRTRGTELEVSGRISPAWQIAGGVALQDARVTSPTGAAAVGARVALVPRTTLSLWNRFQLSRRWGVGLGAIQQAAMFAAIDNTVTLPRFTRLDAAAYLAISRNLAAQLNVENLFNGRYFATANGNNNISPGSPRAVRITVRQEW